MSSLSTETSGSTSKIVAFVLLAVALAAAVLLKDKLNLAAIVALAGVAGSLAFLVLDASRETAETGASNDGSAALIAAIAHNRTEFAQQVATLRKDVAACKADEVGVRESAAVRAEITKLRDALAKL